MQTYTHFLIALAASRPLIQRFKNVKNVPLPQRSAFWFGSVLPDLPLIVMTIVFYIVDLANKFSTNYVEDLFDTWYFESKTVMTLHNLFHGPLSCLFFLLVAYTAWRGCRLAGSGWWFWVVGNAWFHALCDIPVHHNDGPLLLFPFNFTLRFDSPVSYYDPDYYGIPFLIGEHTLDLIIITYECYQCHVRRKESRRQRQAAERGENNDEFQEESGDKIEDAVEESPPEVDNV